MSAYRILGPEARRRRTPIITTRPVDVLGDVEVDEASDGGMDVPKLVPTLTRPIYRR